MEVSDGFYTSLAAERASFHRDEAAEPLYGLTAPTRKRFKSVIEKNRRLIRHAVQAPRQGSCALRDTLTEVLPSDAIAPIDPSDREQLAQVIAVCRRSASLSAAGRELSAVSRRERKSTNDTDRLRKYLARFGLTWDHVG